MFEVDDTEALPAFRGFQIILNSSFSSLLLEGDSLSVIETTLYALMIYFMFVGEEMK